MIRFTEEGRNLSVKDFTSIVDLLHSVGIVFNFDQVNGAVEIFLVAVHLGVQVSRVCLHIIPVTKVPSCIYSHWGMLFHDVFNFTFLCRILFS